LAFSYALKEKRKILFSFPKLRGYICTQLASLYNAMNQNGGIFKLLASNDLALYINRGILGWKAGFVSTKAKLSSHCSHPNKNSLFIYNLS